MKMKSTKMMLIAALAAVVMCAGNAQAAAITQTYGDDSVTMGAVTDNDLDGTSAVATGHGGTPALPSISTHFESESHSSYRKAIAEYSLSEIKAVSTDSADIQSSTLQFFFDDVVFPGNSPEAWTTQSFTLEVYTATANGVLDGSDTDDDDNSVGGTGLDDWSGASVASYTFTAGEYGAYTLGNEIVGIYSPTDLYPAEYGDDQFNLYGMIGFEVDVTSIIAALVTNGSSDYIGFRWTQNDAGGYWTSMDSADYLPTLTTTVVPEPATIGLLLCGSLGLLRKKRQ